MLLGDLRVIEERDFLSLLTRQVGHEWEDLCRRTAIEDERLAPCRCDQTEANKKRAL